MTSPDAAGHRGRDATRQPGRPIDALPSGRINTHKLAVGHATRALLRLPLLAGPNGCSLDHAVPFQTTAVKLLAARQKLAEAHETEESALVAGEAVHEVPFQTNALLSDGSSATQKPAEAHETDVNIVGVVPGGFTPGGGGVAPGTG